MLLREGFAFFASKRSFFLSYLLTHLNNLNAELYPICKSKLWEQR
jgi:hypothetical protein